MHFLMVDSTVQFWLNVSNIYKTTQGSGDGLCSSICCPVTMSDATAIAGLLLFVGTAFTSLAAGKWRSTDELEKQSKTYHGSCHCGKVQFKLVGPRHLVAWDCNCSICHMKKNWHFIVPYADFELLSGSDVLTEYKFNTMVAKHVFCSVCGVQAYYRPRSNPDGVAVTLACVPSEQIESCEIRKFDGNNWEEFFGQSGISKFSKPL
jgi:hypothetical protein